MMATDSMDNMDCPQFVDFTSNEPFEMNDGADFCFGKDNTTQQQTLLSRRCFLLCQVTVFNCFFLPPIRIEEKRVVGELDAGGCCLGNAFDTLRIDDIQRQNEAMNAIFKPHAATATPTSASGVLTSTHHTNSHSKASIQFRQTRKLKNNKTSKTPRTLIIITSSSRTPRQRRAKRALLAAIAKRQRAHQRTRRTPCWRTSWARRPPA